MSDEVEHHERGLSSDDQIRLDERERCAKIAEDTTERPDEWDIPKLIAQRIRSGE